MHLANYAQINDERVDRIDSRVDRIDSRVDKIDRRTEKAERDMQTITDLLQHMSIGVVFIMDATGQRHSVPMQMAGSFNVCRGRVAACLLYLWSVKISSNSRTL